MKRRHTYTLLILGICMIALWSISAFQIENDGNNELATSEVYLNKPSKSKPKQAEAKSFIFPSIWSLIY